MLNEYNAKGVSTYGNFLLSSGAVTDRVAEAVKDQQFEIVQTNLSKEQEDKLRADFGESSET